MSRGVRFLRVAVVAGAVVLLAGCQVRVAVDARVELDGSGTLTVGVGLDDAALARLDDVNDVRLGDLAAAGWQVAEPERRADGYTWLRASKRFRSLDELNRALAELTGDPPVFHGFTLTEEDGGTAVLHRLTGIVDASRGMAAFTDPQLGARLGGDPVAARVTVVEREEGRKLADMVSLDVTAAVTGDAIEIWRPRLDDPNPTRIDVAHRDPKPASSLGVGGPLGMMAVAGVVVVGLLAGARRRFRTPR